MTELFRALLGYGSWGLLLITIILVVVYYEKLEKPVAKIYDFASWVKASWRRHAVKAAIQSNINSFARSIEKDAPNTMPYDMRLTFVSDIDRAELLQDKAVVLVRIRDRKHDDKNLVHAMLAFCPMGLIPASRPYLDKNVSDALDFIVTKKMFDKLQHYSAASYFYESVIKPEVTNRPDLDKVCIVMDRLDEQGLFTKVVLRELRDFGNKLRGRYPIEGHKRETKAFIEYMDAVATKPPGEDLEEVGCLGNYICMGFVFIGRHPKIAQSGATPYLQHIQKLKAMKLERVYIMARDQYIDIAERVSYLADKQNIGKRLASKHYQAADTRGIRRECCLIEMQIAPSFPELPGEQGILFTGE